MKTIHFSLRLSDREMLKYYKGQAMDVVAQDSTGMTIQFPAHILRPFISRTGVHGVFAMTVDDNYKFIAIKKLQDL